MNFISPHVFKRAFAYLLLSLLGFRVGSSLFSGSHSLSPSLCGPFLFFYDYVRCGLWASSGPFPLSAHYGLYKRERDPPTNPSRHLKKERSEFPLKWLLKEDWRRRPTAASAAVAAAARCCAAAAPAAETAASSCSLHTLPRWFTVQGTTTTPTPPPFLPRHYHLHLPFPWTNFCTSTQIFPHLSALSIRECDHPAPLPCCVSRRAPIPLPNPLPFLPSVSDGLPISSHSRAFPLAWFAPATCFLDDHSHHHLPASTFPPRLTPQGNSRPIPFITHHPTSPRFLLSPAIFRSQLHFLQTPPNFLSNFLSPHAAPSPPHSQTPDAPPPEIRNSPRVSDFHGFNGSRKPQPPHSRLIHPHCRPTKIIPRSATTPAPPPSLQTTSRDLPPSPATIDPHLRDFINFHRDASSPRPSPPPPPPRALEYLCGPILNDDPFLWSARRHLPERDASGRASWLLPATPAHEDHIPTLLLSPLHHSKPPQHYLLIAIEFFIPLHLPRGTVASSFIVAHTNLCQRLGCVPNINGSARAFLLPCAASANPTGSWTPRKTHTRLSHVPSLDRRPPASLSSPRPRLLGIFASSTQPPVCRPLVPTYESPTPSPRPTGLAPPQVRHTFPFIFTSKSIFLSVFHAPSPPPSGFSIGECLDDIDRIQTVGPTRWVDCRALPRRLTAQRPQGRGPEGIPDWLYSAYPRIHGGDPRDGTLLVCIISLLHHTRFPLVTISTRC